MTGDPPSVVLSKPTAQASHSSVLEGLVGICTPTGSRTQLDREKGKRETRAYLESFASEVTGRWVGEIEPVVMRVNGSDQIKKR